MISVRDVALCLLVVSIWGVSFTVLKLGLAEIPPLLFVACRFLVAAIPAIFIVPFPSTSIWNVVAIGVLLGILKFGLLFIAMHHDAGAGAASLLLQMQIFLTIFLSYLFFGEKVNSIQITGILLSVAGIFFFLMSAEGNVTYLGFGLLLGAALAWAIANIIMKRLMDVDLLSLMIWASVVPIVPMLFASYFLETRSPISLMSSLSMSSWWAIAYMGYFATVVAYAAWGKLLAKHSSIVIAPFALLIPVIGIATSTLQLDERFDRHEMIGILLIVVGLVMCVIGPKIMTICLSMRCMFARFQRRG